jgi:hypothetical protein
LRLRFHRSPRLDRSWVIFKILTPLVSKIHFNIIFFSSTCLAKGCGLDGRGSIPGRDRSVHTGSGAHPASYAMGAEGSFRGEKRLGREADH